MSTRMIERNDAQSAAVHHLLLALQPFFELRSTMPARCIQTFLLVAQKEGASVSDIAQRAGLRSSIMSRHLLDMGERDRNLSEGAGLVEGRENPENRREKLYSLTPKGRALLASVIKGAAK